MAEYELLPRWRGAYCYFLFRGGPRNGQTISVKFNAPPDTVIDYKSRLPWRVQLNSSYRITAEETQLPDGRTARVAVHIA